MKFLIPLCVCLLGGAMIAIGQNPINSVVMKKNTTFQSDVISGMSEIMIDYPSHGSVSLVDSSGGFYLTYTPDSGYVGSDQVIVEFLSTGNAPNIEYAVFMFDVRHSIINFSNDHFAVSANSDYQFFDVLENDSGSDAPFALDQVLTVSNGYSYVQNDSLFFKPHSSFEGVANLTYKACDTLGYCDKAQAKFIVVDEDNVSNSDTLELFTPQNHSVSFLLEDTGFVASENPDLGVVQDELNGQVFSYVPFQNEHGTDEFEMVNGDSLTRVISVNIIELPEVNQRLVDDYVYTHVDDAVEFNVLENDIINTGLVHNYTQPSHGSVQKIGSGDFIFTPDPGFEGLTTFTYNTCVNGTNCETAVVKIFVGNLNPDNRSTYDLVTPKNRELVINYDVPISNFMFEITQDASFGELDVYPGLDTLQIGCEEVVGYNLVVYTPDQDFVGFDEFDLEYCVNGGADCEVVKVNVSVIDKSLDSVCVCADDCVWPGDVNYDGTVDMKDLLSLGYNIGYEGEARPEAEADQWYGQYCPDWNESQVNEENLKHSDVDGNGIVDLDDTTAIDLFYDKVHTLLSDPIQEPRVYPIQLEIESPANPSPGDFVLMNVYAGTQDDPAYNLHGLHLHFDFHPEIVDTSTVEMAFDQSSWLASNDATVDLIKHQGRSIDGALSRIDGFGKAGFGLVAQVGFIVEDDIDGIRAGGNILPYSVKLSNSSVMLGNGELIRIEDVSTPLYIEIDPEEASDELEVIAYPNPTNDRVNLVLNGDQKMETIAVFDISGRLQFEKEWAPRDRGQLNISQLPEGVYLFQVRTDRGNVINKKVIVSD